MDKVQENATRQLMVIPKEDLADCSRSGRDVEIRGLWPHSTKAIFLKILYG